MRPTAVGMVAEIIDWIEKPTPGGPGRTPVPTEAVLETLQYFLREGPQWRELRATEERASGSTLRRRLMDWGSTALLRHVHAVLIRMVRSGPEAAAEAWNVVVDSCSVRAKHGGEFTGPNPTDRGKPGTKYHLVVSTDGVPLGALPSAANVHDTMMFPDLLRLAMAVCAAIGHLYADAGYDSIDNRGLCLRQGVQPHIRKIGSPHGSGLGAIRCVVEHVNAWLLANKRLDRRNDRSGKIVDALLITACIFMIANRLADL